MTKPIYVLHDYTNEGAFRTMGQLVATIPERVAATLFVLAKLRDRIRMEVATRQAMKMAVAAINNHGEEIHKQYINAPPLTGGFDWHS